MKIDLGCGRVKQEGWFGIDCQNLPGVDLVCDCNLPIPLEDNCADEIRAMDFLEHIDNHKRIHIMTEIWRLLKPGGILTSSTPSTDGRGAFCDPSHFSFWNILSFDYYTSDGHRALYNIVPKFDVVDIHHVGPTHNNILWVYAVLKAVK